MFTVHKKQKPQKFEKYFFSSRQTSDGSFSTLSALKGMEWYPTQQLSATGREMVLYKLSRGHRH